MIYKILLMTLILSSCASYHHETVRQPSSEEKAREMGTERKLMRADSINRIQ